MTLSTTTARIDYPGDDSTGPFAVPFKFFANTDLKVIQRDADDVETVLTYGTDYTVTGAGNADGEVTLATAIASGEHLAILRSPPITQESSFRNQSAYYGSSHESTYDELVMIAQALKDQADRAFRVPESFDPGVVSTAVIPETGKALVWQSSTLLGNSTLDTSSVALPGEGRSVATLTAYLMNNRVYSVLDYDEDAGDGTTDALAAIHEARDYAAAAGGGVVWFGPTSAFYAISGTLKLKSKVKFCGLGMDTTTIKLMAAKHVDTVALYDVNVYAASMMDMTIDGNKYVDPSNLTGNTAGHGVHLDSTGGVFASGYADPYNHFYRVRVINAAQDNWHHTGSGVNMWDYCTSIGAGLSGVGPDGNGLGHGFYLDGFDSFLKGCVASTSQQANFFLASPNNTLTGCKSFYAGRGMTNSGHTGDGLYCNTARNRISDFECQDNGRHGAIFISSSCKNNTVVNLHCARNGNMGFGTPVGLRLDACVNNTFTNYQATQSTGTYQKYAIGLANTPTGNTIVGQSVEQATGHITGTSMVTGNSILLNGQRPGFTLTTSQGAGTYTPDPTVARAIFLTVTGDINFADAAAGNKWDGCEMDVTFIQSGGAYDITMNAAYHVTFSNTGKADGKHTTIGVRYDGAAGFWRQKTPQTTYVT